MFFLVLGTFLYIYIDWAPKTLKKIMIQDPVAQEMSFKEKVYGRWI